MASFWKNVDSGQGEEEHFQQMEEAQLEEAGDATLGRAG